MWVFFFYNHGKFWSISLRQKVMFKPFSLKSINYYIHWFLGDLLKIDENKTNKINSLASYLSNRKHSFKVYTLVYFICLTSNFLISTGQLILILNMIGDSIFNFSLFLKDQSQSDHLIFEVFPTEIVCELCKVVASGQKGMLIIHIWSESNLVSFEIPEVLNTFSGSS